MMKPPHPEDENGGLEKMSREDLKKIEKSMKRPEFMGLLNEYMMEISDPKNKQEYDEYLKQMQKQGELPKHMKLVELKPQFCFKTDIVSTVNKRHAMKFFINMCSSEYIEKPSCQPGPNGGFNWKVPNSMGKIRHDQVGKQGNDSVCQVADCAFHPDSFNLAVHPSFQAMIISIALESAEKQLGERKQTLSRDYVIMKKLKCKSHDGKPALLPIRYIEGKAYSRGEGPTEFQRDMQGKETKLQKQLNKQKEQYQKEKGSNENKKIEKDQEEEEEDIDDQGAKKKLVEDLETGIQAPKYSSIYTYKTDYSEFMDGPVMKKTRKLPNTFTVQFKVPRMENIGEASQLEINENKIIFAVEGKYYADLSFEDLKAKKYPLRTAESKAKFDKKKKVLRVAIPVDIQSLPQQEQTEQEVNKQNEQQIIEDETWKNKVLDFTEQNVSTKFIEKEQFEQKPEKKLVEEIDEDDVEPENGLENKLNQGEVVEKKVGGVQEEEDQDQIREKDGEEEEQGMMFKTFTLRPYYENQPIKQQKQPQRITPISNILFRQSYDKKQAILTVPLRNYEDSDVECASQNGQLILFWRSRRSGIHLAIRKQKRQKFTEVICLKRVGFCAFVINLNNEQSEELKKQDLLVDFLQENGEWGVWSNFVQNVETISKAMAEAVEMRKFQKQQQQAEQKRLEEEKEESKQKQIEASDKKLAIKSETQQSQLPKMQKKMQQIDESITNQQKQIISPHNNYPIIGNKNEKLPIQFIRFNAPFIETLN